MPSYIKILLLIFSTLLIQNANAGWVTDEGSGGDAQICSVTVSTDNGDDQNSLRRKLERGFNLNGEKDPKFCRKKIILKSDVNLKAPIIINNSNDGDGLIIESDSATQRVINASSVTGEFAIKIKSNKITLKNIVIKDASTNNAIYVESDYNIFENVLVENTSNGTGLFLDGDNNNITGLVATRNTNGLVINGINNTVTGSVFKENKNNGVTLNNSSANEVTKNAYYNNTGVAMHSPITDIAPTIESGTKISSSQYSVLISFDADVQRVELYRTFPKAGDVTLIGETTEFTSRTATFTFDANSGESVFAIAFLNKTTSAMSNVQPLSEFGSGNGGGNVLGCNGVPIESGTIINRICAVGVGSSELQDSDCDGIYDNKEDLNKNCQWDPSSGETDAKNSDSDGDGLFDGQEDKNKNGIQDEDETNPNDEDSDGDTIADGIEDQNKNGVRNTNESDPKSNDTDADGIPDNLEDVNQDGKWDDPIETKAFNNDTDLDGLKDGAEDKNNNGQVDPGESDPRKKDSDQDQLPDGNDLCPTDPDTTCTKPCIPGQAPDQSQDTDFDGIPDFWEDFNHTCVVDANETSPKKSDTDDDGSNDRLDPCPKNNDKSCITACVPGAQVAPQYDPDGDGVAYVDEDKNHNCIADGGETDFNKADTDMDGIIDGVEIKVGMDPLKKDSDNDGIDDGDEDLNKDGVMQDGETNPIKQDTDSDGTKDSLDACPSDPNPDCKNQCIQGKIPSDNIDSDSDGIANKFEDLDHDCNKDSGETSAFDNDTDKDGVHDGTEDINSNGLVDIGEMDPKKIDSDNDGIQDGTEDLNKNGQADPGETNPTKADSDGDGINDGQDSCALDADPKCEYQCVPGIAPSNPFQDSDNDGLKDTDEDKNLNCVADFGETDPAKADSDGDGLPDGLEDKNKNAIRDAGETDPKNVDSDGDGLSDGVEDKNKDGFVAQDECNPAVADTDGDGIADQFEDKNKNGIFEEGETSCYLADSDFDGINDGAEDANKNGKCDPGETCSNLDDTDGDGAKDGQELSQGTNPLLNKAEHLKKAQGTANGCSINKQARSASTNSYWLLALACLPALLVRSRRKKN